MEKREFYVVDDQGKVVQRSVSLQDAIVLCLQHREYHICRWINGNLKLVSPCEIKVA